MAGHVAHDKRRGATAISLGLLDVGATTEQGSDVDGATVACGVDQRRVVLAHEPSPRGRAATKRRVASTGRAEEQVFISRYHPAATPM